MRPCRNCCSRSKKLQASRSHIAFSPAATPIWVGLTMPEIVQRGLRCHSLSSATECPSERREPDDRQHNSAGHCTPYRWFHPGMDLHVVTLAWEKGFLRFQINQEPLARGEPAKIDSETNQTTPARLDCRYRRQCLSTRRWGALLPRKPVKITIAPSRARSQAMSPIPFFTPSCRALR
jgi:hypothetical protein